MVPVVVEILRNARPMAVVDHVIWPGRTIRGRPALPTAGSVIDVLTIVWLVVTRGAPVPTGHRIQPVCGHPMCIRPEHVRAVPTPRWATRHDNPQHREPPGRPPATTCDRGHDMLAPVVVLWSNGKRRCRICAKWRSLTKTAALGKTDPRHRRGPDGRYPVCRKGHPLVPGNVLVDKGGARRCRTCRRASTNRRRALVKAS